MPRLEQAGPGEVPAVGGETVIGSLRGTVLDRLLRGDHQIELLVEVAGVGYRVLVPGGCARRCGQLGAPTFLHVHTHVREDAMVLYGFPFRARRGTVSSCCWARTGSARLWRWRCFRSFRRPRCAGRCSTTTRTL